MTRLDTTDTRMSQKDTSRWPLAEPYQYRGTAGIPKLVKPVSLLFESKIMCVGRNTIKWRFSKSKGFWILPERTTFWSWSTLSLLNLIEIRIKRMVYTTWGISDVMSSWASRHRSAGLPEYKKMLEIITANQGAHRVWERCDIGTWREWICTWRFEKCHQATSSPTLVWHIDNTYITFWVERSNPLKWLEQYIRYLEWKIHCQRIISQETKIWQLEIPSTAEWRLELTGSYPG